MNSIVVMIIDTGVATLMGLGAFFLPTGPVHNYHGTGVAYIATGLEENVPMCDSVQFISCNWYEDGTIMPCLRKAAELPQLDFVNLSVQGEGWNAEEFVALQALTERGAILTVASGNQRVKDLSKSNSYPAAYLYHNLTNYRVVTDPTLPASNLGPGLIEDMGITMVPTSHTTKVLSSGTSFAAPRYLRKLLTSYCLEISMFKKGLGNQCTMR